MLFSGLNVPGRQLSPELMDQPTLEAGRHAHALRALARINRLSNSAGLLWPAVREWALRHPEHPLRLLDLATGAGDVPVSLWRRARRAGLALEVEGWDKSSTAIEHARSRAAHAHADIQFKVHDLKHELIPPDFDIITCSLFLHHLDEAEAIDLLRRMGGAARHLVLVNDLARSRSGLALAWLGVRLLTTCDVVHADGPQSVRAAWTPEEALALAKRAGLNGATVSRRWPCRFLLRWEKQ